MRGRGKPWQNRKPQSTDLSLRAAEVVADVTETDRPQERGRLVSAFIKAAASGARVASSGARAAGRGTRVVQRRASEGTGWLADQVVAMAPRLRVRDRAALQAQFPGKSPDAIADALIEGAARAAAAAGGAVGMASALPVLPAFPVEIAAETLVLVGIELKLVAELHEAYGSPAPGRFPERMSAYVAAWAHRRGVFMIEGGLIFAAGLPAGAAAAPAAGGQGRPQRVLSRPDAHRRRRGRAVQPQGNQEARPGHPA